MLCSLLSNGMKFVLPVWISVQMLKPYMLCNGAEIVWRKEMMLRPSEVTDGQVVRTDISVI